MKKTFFSLLIIYILSSLLLSSCAEDVCLHESTEWRVLSEATFLSEGERENVCLECGVTLEEGTLPQLLCPHETKDWVESVAATYEAAGVREYACKDCNRVFESETIPMLVCEHTNTEWVEDTSRKLICRECERTLIDYPLPANDPLSAEEVKDMLKDSVFKVYCYDYDGIKIKSEGSGFFIDSEGTFITNAHVVKNAYFVKIQTVSGEFYDVNIMYVYNTKGTDHAICKAEGCASTPVTFNPSFEVGGTVFALGYPGEQNKLVITEGKITAEEKTVENVTYIPNSALIIDGNSGGLLANDRGEVIGITTGYTPPDEYLALRFDEFSADLIAARAEKTLFSYFHTKREISLDVHNFDDIFEITSENGQAKVALKSRFSKEKVGFFGKPAVLVTYIDGSTSRLEFESEAQMKNGILLDVPLAEVKLVGAEGTVIFYNTFLSI